MCDDEFVMAYDGSPCEDDNIPFGVRRSHVLRATDSYDEPVYVCEPPYLIWLPSPL